MAYIPSYQTLADHPKLKRLCRRLQIRDVEAIGHLHCFWWWAMDYAKNGSLCGHDELDIAIASRWDGDEHVYTAALIECGFIDESKDGERCIHDWDDYGGVYQDKRERDALRKREERAAKKAEADVQRTVNGCPTDISRTSDGNPMDGSTRRGEEKREDKKTGEENVNPLPPIPIRSDQKVLPENGEAQKIVAAYCQAAQIERPADYGRSVSTAGKMAKAGIVATDIAALFTFVASWSDGPDLGILFGSIDKWRAGQHLAPKIRAGPKGRSAGGLDGQGIMDYVNGVDREQTRDGETVIDATGRVVERDHHHREDRGLSLDSL